MKRNLNQLSNQHFDTLIIGGGIHGAVIALELARAGVKTALIEKKDFSHATSANSLKIIHGGFRYLQHLNLKRMRESIKSRRDMMRFAPHLIKPLACVIPSYGYGLMGKEVMLAALFLNDLISRDRNKRIDIDHHLSEGRILSKARCLELIPNINQEGLRGACLWYDALALDTERLTLAYIKAATEYTACVANYVQATEVIVKNGRVAGVKASDVITNAEFEIKADTVVNATGPWIDKIIAPLAITKGLSQNWARGMNIVVKKKLFSDTAVGLQGEKPYIDRDAVFKKAKRLFFFVPWRGYTMIGTSYKPYQGNPNDLNITRNDILEIIDDVNIIYPTAALTIEDVSFFHGGLLPMKNFSENKHADLQLDKTSQVINHDTKDGVKGFLSIKSVKYTTAPQTAQVVKRMICEIVKPVGLDRNRLQKRLQMTHSHNAANRDRHPLEDNRLDEWISKDPPLTAAAIVGSIREEMALTLSDIVFRRNGLGTAECPSADLLEKVAEIAAVELKWDQVRKDQEINAVLNRFAPLMVARNGTANVPPPTKQPCYK